jgi:hypothetical protein
MNTVGQIERKTQDRVVALFQHTLGYEYLGDWADRAGNANIEQELLCKQVIDDTFETRAAQACQLKQGMMQELLIARVRLNSQTIKKEIR